MAHLKTIALYKQVSFLCFFFGHVIDYALEELLHGNLAGRVLIGSFTSSTFYSAFLSLSDDLRFIITVIRVVATVQSHAPTRSVTWIVERPRLDHGRW